MEELVEGFERHMRVKGYSAKTRKVYQLGVAWFRSWFEGRGLPDVRRVRLEDLREYQRWLAVKYEERLSIQALAVQGLKRFFEYLENSGEILVNPGARIRESKKHRPLPKSLTEDEVERLLAQPDVGTPRGVRDRAMLEVFYSTGIRLEELAALRLEDIDLAGGVVRVNHGKGGKDRVVPMGEEAAYYLKAYLNNVRPGLLKARPNPSYAVVTLDIPQVWVRMRGAVPVSSQMVEVWVRCYGKKAGLKVNPHLLRHSFATHMVRHGADIAVVSKMLGHSNLRTTQGYVKVAGVEVKEAHGRTHPRERDTEEAVVAAPVKMNGDYGRGRWK